MDLPDQIVQSIELGSVSMVFVVQVPALVPPVQNDGITVLVVSDLKLVGARVGQVPLFLDQSQTVVGMVVADGQNKVSGVKRPGRKDQGLVDQVQGRELTRR